MLLESFEKAASNNDSRMVALRGGRGGGDRVVEVKVGWRLSG